MFANAKTKISMTRIGTPLVIASLIIASVYPACAGFTIGAPSKMLSQGPCLYSTQLQKSVSVRKSYLVKLSAATGGQLPVTSDVEAMYSNIKSVSYSVTVTAADDELWGIGSQPAAAAPVGIDSFSTECISCHDGASALAIGANVRNEPFARGPHSKYSANDHPIGMDYQSYVGANPRKYKAVLGSENKMVFVNGKVGCLTCHDPLNPERKHLVMSDKKSALCLTCHDT